MRFFPREKGKTAFSTKKPLTKAIFPFSRGKNRISQGVENWGSLISVPLALREPRGGPAKILYVYWFFLSPQKKKKEILETSDLRVSQRMRAWENADFGSPARNRNKNRRKIDFGLVRKIGKNRKKNRKNGPQTDS